MPEGFADVIRIDHIWLGVEPVDMRSGMDRLRMQVLVHDGFGVWMAVRRLHQGQFAWPTLGSHVNLSVEQAHALVVGLPWQRLNAEGPSLL